MDKFKLIKAKVFKVKKLSRLINYMHERNIGYQIYQSMADHY
jgi:hypothetical protein